MPRLTEQLSCPSSADAILEHAFAVTCDAEEIELFASIRAVAEAPGPRRPVGNELTQVDDNRFLTSYAKRGKEIRKDLDVRQAKRCGRRKTQPLHEAGRGRRKSTRGRMIDPREPELPWLLAESGWHPGE